MELLVVIAIIGVLATIVLGALNEARAKARDARRHSDIRTIQNQLELYYVDHGEYPIRTWTRSYTPSQWNALAVQLGIELPLDPINENTAYSYQGGKNYIYYSNGTTYLGCPEGQWYLLFYNQEGVTTAEQNVGVTKCSDGTKFKQGSNSITVGASPAQ